MADGSHLGASLRVSLPSQPLAVVSASVAYIITEAMIVLG